jgi:O-antigen/teichoic acid export membrane protein
MNFISIMLAWLAGIILNTWLNYYKAKTLAPINFLFDIEYIKHIIKISLPYGIALFLSVVYFKIDIILLWILEPGDIGNKSIWLYSLPMKIVEVVMVIGWFYLNSLLPTLTKLFKDKDSTKLNNILTLSTKIMLATWAVIFTLGTLFRYNIISIISDESVYLSSTLIYNSADALFVVLAVVLFYFISLIYIYIFIASKNQWQLLKINIAITLFNIIGNIILIPKYSFMWAGITTLISQILLVSLWYYYSRNIISFRFPILFAIKIALLNVILFTIWSIVLQNISLWPLLNILVYGGWLFSVYTITVYLILNHWYYSTQ